MSLSDDEYTVLMIANEGQSIAAIGRWEKPVDSLVARGFMHRNDKFNNIITLEGKTVCDARVDQDAHDLVQAFRPQDQKAQEVKGSIQDFIEQAAQHIARSAKASAVLTGGDTKTAARRWNALLLERTLELL